jgi:hypothetical protein
MVSIDERPDITDRCVAGHWEGDLIVGAGNRSAIGTLERTSRYTILLHLAGDRSANAVKAAVIAAFAALPVHLRRSLTWDQGNEMAFHADITRTLGPADLLLSSAFALAAPDEREHQRAVTPVLPQGHGPVAAHGRLRPRRRRRAQCPTSPGPPLGHPASHVQYAPERPSVATMIGIRPDDRGSIFGIWPTFRDRVSFVWVCRGGLVITQD